MRIFADGVRAKAQLRYGPSKYNKRATIGPPVKVERCGNYSVNKGLNLLDRSRENLILLHANMSADQTAHPQSDPCIG